jgi:hypothetical protein
LHNLFFTNDLSLIAVLCIEFISLSIIIAWFFVSPSNRSRIQQYEGVVAPFFNLPAVLFSLTAALLATSVWDNYSVVTNAIKNESQGILSIISLANSVPDLTSTNLPNSARAYTQSIIDDEWKELSNSRSNSSVTYEKFVAMRAAVLEAANMLSDKAESKALLNAFYTINNARETRLAYAEFDLHPIRWYAILFLGVLVLISVAFIHLSKPKALMVAMAIATLTILTPLCILALTLSNPYQGLISISNDPYLQILNRGVIDLVW